MSYILSALAALAAAYTLRWSFRLYFNYRAARATGIPYLLCPANPNSALFMVFSIPLRPLFLCLLPAWLWRRLRVQIYGWEYLLRGAPQAELGPVFWVVAPEGLKLWIAEPEAAADVLARRKDFGILDVSKRVIGRFGPNVLVADGEDWQRQRRIIAPIVNERISGVVWDESRAQARQMLAYFAGRPNGETDRAIIGARTIAMNVLGSAGYGTPARWTPDGEKGLSPPPGHKMSFLEAIATIADNLLPATVVAPWICKLPFMPDSVKRMGIAADEFEPHADAILRQEREKSGRVDTAKSLTATMVRISDSEKKATGQGKTALHLSEAEMRGAIFQFTDLLTGSGHLPMYLRQDLSADAEQIAGYDTTANTMGYAFAMLALHPEWQEWLAQELDKVLPNSEADVDYESTFPKLPRTLALMYETMRLYTPVQHISRQTVGPQTLTTSTGTHTLPPGAEVFISGSSLHVSPAVWGADPLTFRPTRFLSSATTSSGKEQGETLREPPKGAFVPWSAGPRVCPGMKMSQVEFVAVLATACRSFRIEPATTGGESEAAAKTRLEALVADSQPIVTLQMKRPREVRLRWVAWT